MILITQKILLIYRKNYLINMNFKKEVANGTVVP